MHHVNDDMDELFRRAGQEYPLNISGANWEKIAKELSTVAVEKPRPGRDKRKFLWLLLLLPFGFICTHYFTNKKGAGRAETEDYSRSLAEKTGPGNTAAPQKETNSGRKISVDDKEHTVVGQKWLKSADRSNTHSYKQAKTGSSVVAESKTEGNDWRINTNPGTWKNKEEPDLLQRQRFFDLRADYPSLRIASQSPQTENLVAFAEKKKEHISKNKKFYAGLMGGLDISSIKFQKVENVGYDAGLLFGYDLNKRWGFEVGLFRDKKFYYSKGEYFNTSKIYLPANSEISSVDGNCIMWELPVNVRYNLKSSTRKTWFVTGGVSSYFMKKEDYNYVYYYPATGQSYKWESYYKNASKHLVAVAQFSAGYTHPLGKIGDLRVEPYVKLPLKGVGIGSVSLHSAGVHIGITRKLF